VSAGRRSYDAAGRRARVVSRENLVVGLFVVLAFPAALVVDEYTGAPSWAQMAALFVVGIGLPQAVNYALDRSTDDGDG